MKGGAIVCAGCAEREEVLGGSRYRLAEDLELEIAVGGV